MRTQYIIPFEELGKDDWEVVGKKCANLGEMTKIGMPVPPGFALTIECHSRFTRETGLTDQIRQYMSRTFPGGLKDLKQYQEASIVICNMIETKEIPHDIQDEVIKSYRELCNKMGAEQVPVAVRSAGAKSHPGRYDTYLNIKGEKELLKNIIKVWSSAYNMRSIASICQEGLSIEDSPPIGTAIQCLINARASGVGFTVQPVTGDQSIIVLESSWGMGESIVGGTVCPDKHIIDKKSLKIVEKIPGSKTSQIICCDEGNTIEREVHGDKQLAFCIDDEEAKRIAKLGISLELHFGSPQDFEWAISSGSYSPDNLFLLQTRAVVGVKKGTGQGSTTDKIIDMMLNRMFDSNSPK